MKSTSAASLDGPATAPTSCPGCSFITANGSSVASSRPERTDKGWISRVVSPDLTVYKPAVDRPNGSAVIVRPGGYERLAMDH